MHVAAAVRVIPSMRTEDSMYSLRRRPKSNDHDLIDDGTVIGQVIASDRGHTIYLLGDFGQLLDPAESADAALEAFEDWAASNTHPTTCWSLSPTLARPSKTQS